MVRQRAPRKVRPKVGEWYIYNPSPVGLDRLNPTVLKGRPIAPGSAVRVTRADIDPRRLLVFVVDRKGNQQSVYATSLTKPSPEERSRKGTGKKATGRRKRARR